MSPVIPIVIISAAAATVGVVGYLRGWFGGEKPTPIPDDDKDVTDVDPQPTPSDSARCERTGSYYDVARYSSPAKVAADMTVLGFPVTNKLTTSSDRQLIKKAQRRFRELKLAGMDGAGDEWIDGKMGACTLLSVGAGMTLHSQGQWPGPGGG